MAAAEAVAAAPVTAAEAAGMAVAMVMEAEEVAAAATVAVVVALAGPAAREESMEGGHPAMAVVVATAPVTEAGNAAGAATGVDMAPGRVTGARDTAVAATAQARAAMAVAVVQAVATACRTRKCTTRHQNRTRATPT